MTTVLRGLQRDLQRHVLEFDQRSLKTVSRHVVSTEKVSADLRLSIYANGYRLRLIEALATEFGTLRRIAGEKTFDALCRSFIATHPSRAPNLRWYGSELAAHLERTAPFDRRPVLAEIARFEWAIGLAFDAADDKALTFEEVAALPPQSWPAMAFSLHPSVQRLDLAWNAPDLFKATDSGDVVKPRRATKPRHWCIWRRELTPRYRRLPADEAWMLDAVARGESFAAICEGLTQWSAEDAAAARAATLLRNWIAEQMVSAVQVDLSNY
jgi:hypothetical protein